MRRILHNEIECFRHNFANQHGTMKDKPFIQRMAESLLRRIVRKTGLLVLQPCPICFESLDELVDIALTTKLSLQITYECVSRNPSVVVDAGPKPEKQRCDLANRMITNAVSWLV